MNKIRNHTLGAAVTAVTLAAVVLTGCGNPEPDECDEAQSMSVMSMTDGMAGKVGGGSGSRGGGGGSRGGGGKVNTNKPGAVKQKPSTGNSSGGSSGGSGKVKHHDFDECEDDD